MPEQSGDTVGRSGIPIDGHDVGPRGERRGDTGQALHGEFVRAALLESVEHVANSGPLPVLQQFADPPVEVGPVVARLPAKPSISPEMVTCGGYPHPASETSIRAGMRLPFRSPGITEPWTVPGG